jgi:hypothetical protein
MIYCGRIFMADVNGSWLGTYWQLGEPTRFEVVFIQSGNSLTGSILDDSYLGEARLSGEVIERSISFSKSYLITSPDSVKYVGTVSEDEDYMQGNWSIGIWDYGNWEAYRSGDALKAITQTDASQNIPVAIGF